jgi:FMN phosphatase YigB (HAD superfamily)
MLDRVFLFDVDNTLLDNDRLQDELRAHLAESYGQDARDRYWAIFQELFKDLGYALAAVAHARTLGPISILSDGDAVFQPVKIARSGLRAAFEDEVLIYIHKEQELADIEHWRPARHYVMIDDKPRILGAMKKAWGDRVTTVWVRQGHYAAEAGAWDGWPPPDRDIAAIGDFAGLDFPAP